MMQNNNSIVSLSDIRELSILKTWKSILIILVEWLIIIACVFAHKMYSNIVMYFMVWFIISTRLYAMYSLIHEAIHYSISRNKVLNDGIAQFFLGIPLFISITEIRKAHLAHHKYLQTENDPEMKHLLYNEFQFPKTKTQIAALFFLDISGINFVYYKLLKLFSWLLNFDLNKLKDAVKIILFAIVFVVAYYNNFLIDLMLYWLIPFATLYQLLNRIRLSTEHFNIDETNAFKTRSVIPSFMEKCIFSPHNLGYHLEHHLYPGIPFYNLPKLHDKLINDSDYVKNAIVESSYTEVLKDFIK